MPVSCVSGLNIFFLVMESSWDFNFFILGLFYGNAAVEEGGGGNDPPDELPIDVSGA